MKTRRLLITLALGLAAASLPSPAQQAPANFDPSFAVATIKPADPTDPRRMLMLNKGVLQAKNFPMVGLISFAYDIKSDSLLSNLPDWANQRYDIEAREEEEEAAILQKIPQEKRGPITRRMLQKLLEERLHLKLVKEQKEQPVYALVVAKGGSKLKPTAAPPPPPAGSEPSAARRPIGNSIRLTGRGELSSTSVTTAMLADVISHMPEAEGRVVVDRTGLTGNYDFTLKWTPEAPAPVFRGADAGAPPPPAPDSSGPTLVTALEEQLGLKLESTKAMVDSYRVAQIDKPSEN